MYGNPEVTPGGKALKFYASVRLDVRKGEPIKESSAIIGNRTKIKVVKNKLAPPFKTVEVDSGLSNPIPPFSATSARTLASISALKSGFSFMRFLTVSLP